MAQKLIKSKRATKAIYVPAKGLAQKVDSVEKEFIRSDLPAFKAGDTVKVSVRIQEGEKERVQAYEGTVIKISNRGSGKSFTVRKISHGVGVERVFMYASARVAKVELLQSGRVRRAKLYYLRGLEGRSAKIEREMVAGAPGSAAAKKSN